jgi:hypothetical protein
MKILSTKSPKRHFAIVTVLYLIAMSVLVISDVNSGLNDGLFLNVAAAGKHSGTYIKKPLADGSYFVSGIEGTLYWKPRTFIESLLLSSVNNNTFDLLDVLTLTAIAGAILYMFRGSNNSVLFTKSLARGFSVLVLVIALSGMFADMARMEIARRYIPYITQGQFASHLTFKFPSFSYLIYPLLIFLIQIPKKGLELQQQQELTI